MSFIYEEPAQFLGAMVCGNGGSKMRAFALIAVLSLVVITKVFAGNIEDFASVVESIAFNVATEACQSQDPEKVDSFKNKGLDEIADVWKSEFPQISAKVGIPILRRSWNKGWQGGAKAGGCF